MAQDNFIFNNIFVNQPRRHREKVLVNIQPKDPLQVGR
jgi:hypothetical protein